MTPEPDNPALFKHNHPECDWFYIKEFHGDGDHDLNPERFGHFEHDLEYRNVDGKYGMYVKEKP